eukprot:1737338-Prymnesium_polylepis.1
MARCGGDSCRARRSRCESEGRRRAVHCIMITWSRTAANGPVGVVMDNHGHWMLIAHIVRGGMDRMGHDHEPPMSTTGHAHARTCAVIRTACHGLIGLVPKDCARKQSSVLLSVWVVGAVLRGRAEKGSARVESCAR